MQLPAQMSHAVTSPMPQLSQKALSRIMTSPHSQAQFGMSTASAVDDDVSPRSSLQKSERRTALAAFKRAVKRGNCTLKELIDQFFIIEERYLIKEYTNGIR